MSATPRRNESWLKRVGWLAAIWVVSVVALAVVALALRSMMRLAGLTS